MNWSKTKNIFIICFLLLDIFLAYQLVMRQKDTHNQMNTNAQTPFSQYLKDNAIKINTQLPDSNQAVQFLSGVYVDFSNQSNLELQKALTALEGTQKNPVQTFSFGADPNILQSTFSKNMNIAVPETQTDQQAFLTQYVYQGDNYRFWSYDKQNNLYRFIQTYNGHPVFSIANGKLNTLDVSLSKDGKTITGYVQSYIDIKAQKPQKSTKLGIQPMDALQKLWNDNKLPVIDHPTVDKMDLGYISLSESGNQVQTLTYLPAWYVKVSTNGATNEYLVTGIYGKIQTINRR